MVKFSQADATFVGTALETFCYGAYASLFALYLTLQRRRKQRLRDGCLNIVMTLLFFLCTLYLVLDVARSFFVVSANNASPEKSWKLDIGTCVVFSLADFLAQAVLIYRCWIIFDRKYAPIVAPAVLSILALGAELALPGYQGSVTAKTRSSIRYLSVPTGIASFTASMVVNALITGLIVTKVWRTYSRTQTMMPGRQSDLQQLVIAMIIESGVLVFVSQILWTVFFALQGRFPGGSIIEGMTVQIYGIAPTILGVRVSLGASLDDTTTCNSSSFSKYPVQLERGTGSLSSTRIPIPDQESGILRKDAGLVPLQPVRAMRSPISC